MSVVTSPLLIYVAGPYRAKTVWGIEENIHRARAMGVQLAQRGAYPVIPHSNTAHFDGEAPDEMWLNGTLELMRRCDGVVFLETWRQSSGARAEHEEVVKLRIPWFFAGADNTSLWRWLEIGVPKRAVA